MIAAWIACLAILSVPAPEAPVPAAVAPPTRGPVDLAPPEVLDALGPFSALPGAWTEYVVRSAGGAQARVRISVVPPEEEGGRYWLEVASLSSSGLAGASRMLLRGPPTDARAIERLILYVPGIALSEVPLEEVRSVEPPPPRTSTRVLQRGSSSVRVRAGAFRAERMRVGRTTVWRSAAVPLWGLVRAEGPAGSAELAGYANAGAHSVLPQEALATVHSQGTGKERTK